MKVDTMADNLVQMLAEWMVDKWGVMKVAKKVDLRGMMKVGY